MAYQVTRRRREIAIRIALGATRHSVVGMVLGQTTRLTAAGCAIGGIVGVALTRVADGFLFQVEPNDPLTFTLAMAGLILIGLGAAFFPGRRAAGANPVETLRAE